MDRILNWTLQYSADTLETLLLDQNDLTDIPWQFGVPSFSKLYSLSLDEQKRGVLSIPTDSFYIIPDEYLYVAYNSLTTIEPGAFQGDFHNARIYLGANLLARFEEGVFKEMLTANATVYLYSNGTFKGEATERLEKLDEGEAVLGAQQVDVWGGQNRHRRTESLLNDLIGSQRPSVDGQHHRDLFDRLCDTAGLMEDQFKLV
ncbi:hypothetical protein DAPPUDRAFT_340376 [Daphnia pulex]|uniref:Uncharacterized protein n=1 Tax=Daphnia pulex TaxID=6669 RepID=E9I438_DAPPU|nr:hypothetical protein DAPPUDRAFT_340376 [Daphnia pulex]|eukprot:EFX61242.1 hypothetical protein DAPPUDRAFT_340376 [Daphnia pulex]